MLEGEQTKRFWDISLPAAKRASFRWTHLLDAPIIALPLADASAYTARYAEPDKARTGLGAGADAWPVPYWTIDTSMAVMTFLLAAQDADLGALFFGVFHNEAALRVELGIPDDLELLGAIALGHPLDDEDWAWPKLQSGAPVTGPDHPPQRLVTLVDLRVPVVLRLAPDSLGSEGPGLVHSESMPSC